MGNKDIKKGIAIQAKVDAAKVDKLANGLRAHKDVLLSLENGQHEIRDAMGIVLDDLSDSDAYNKFDLEMNKSANEMDITEKRVLCACIYTLLSSYNQENKEQIEFYKRMEKYLGVAERKNDFDFLRLKNVDSYTDRIIILKIICSFLFLGEHSFSFLREREEYYWLYAFASVKDISDVCLTINSEYATLGTDGILDNFNILKKLNFKEDSSEEIGNNTSESTLLDDPFETNGYEALSKVIIDQVSNEVSFGKGVELSEKEIKKELPKEFNIAYDSLVAITKIEKGYLFFTTYGLYLRVGATFKYRYVCIPYNKIVVDKIMTTGGKQAGTRKLIIPINEDNEIKRIEIDDSVLEEEKLRDLICNLTNTKLSFPKNDRERLIKDLSQEDKKSLLSILIYALKVDNRPLIDVFMLAKEWNLIADWNEIGQEIKDNNCYDKKVSTFINYLPYPSQKTTSLDVMKLLMGLIASSNILQKNDMSLLSFDAEQRIRKFDLIEITPKDFNLMLKKSLKSIKLYSYDEYLDVLNSSEVGNLYLGNLIKEGAANRITLIEDELEYKAKMALKKAQKNAIEVVEHVHKKVANGVKGIIDKSKKSK